MSCLALTYCTIDEDAFIHRFRPIPNHLEFDSGFDYGNGSCLFSAAGKSFKHVLAQDRRRIWTVIEGDEGQLFIESGLHIVNRLGYIITAEPIADGMAYSVLLDT
jgi:hypothetical protein